MSIQSCVAYGHVGNASAVFPLQRLGAEVSAINTVEFSNHPGYGAHTGATFSPASIRTLVDGLADRDVLATCDALLSGYLGDPGTGEVVLETAERLRTANPTAVWCCDPVIGDKRPGIYVRPGVAEFFRDRAVPRADILTPNHFELTYLTGQPCATLPGVQEAVAALQARMHQAGPRIVLVTSLETETQSPDELGCLVGAGGAFHCLTVPRLPVGANGAGDAMAALFLFHILAGRAAHMAMETAASSMHGVLERTLADECGELRLVAAQEEFVQPSQVFISVPC